MISIVSTDLATNKPDPSFEKVPGKKYVVSRGPTQQQQTSISQTLNWSISFLVDAHNEAAHLEECPNLSTYLLRYNNFPKWSLLSSYILF